jgi:hypothetical protein
MAVVHEEAVLEAEAGSIGKFAQAKIFHTFTFLIKLFLSIKIVMCPPLGKKRTLFGCFRCVDVSRLSCSLVAGEVDRVICGCGRRRCVSNSAHDVIEC